MFNKIKLAFSPLTKDERELLVNLMRYEVPEYIQIYYKNCIRNNKHDSKEIIKKKLVRNIVLGNVICEGYNLTEVQYGNLMLVYNRKDKKIHWICNNKGYYKFDVDLHKKEWLNKYLGIKKVK